MARTEETGTKSLFKVSGPPDLRPPSDTGRRRFSGNAAKGLMVVALVVLALFCFFFPDALARLTFQQSLKEAGAELIDNSLKANIIAFGGLSVLKGGIYMIEGSTIGFGLDIQIGDIVQPACDYIDFIWTAFLWAFMVLGIYKILLETDLLQIGVYLVGTGCLMAAISFFLGRAGGRWMRWWAARAILTGALMFYVVPLSLVASHEMTQRYLEPFKQEQLERMAQVEKDFETSRHDFLSLKDEISLLNPRQSIKTLTVSVLAIVRSVTDLISQNAWGFLFYILIVLFEILALPLLTALGLYYLVRFSLGATSRASPYPELWPELARK